MNNNKKLAISDQAKAANKIQEFLLNKEEKYFVLLGRAGTGKTYLINVVLNMMNELYDNFKYKNIIFTAISNKAVSVLYNGAGSNKGKYSYKTLFKLLKKEVSIDEKGKTVFTSNRPTNSATGFIDLLIIDEASMIDDITFKEIIDFVGEHTKIIFLADKYQCPPPSDSSNTFLHKYLGYELTIPFRYDQNIGSVVEYVRTCVDTLVPIDEFKINLKKILNNDVILYSSKVNFINSAIEKLNKNPNKVIVLAYKNVTVNSISKVLRDKIFGEDADEYEKGETLICNFSKGNLGSKIYINSNLYQIDEIKKSCINILKENDRRLLDISLNEEKLDIFNLKDKYFIYENVYCYHVKLYCFEQNICTTTYLLDNNSKVKLKSICNKFFTLLKKHKFKSKKLAFEFNKLSNLFHIFTPAYTMNVYKSQGSTYDEVFVYVDDILNLKSVSLKDKYRALYTAMTRAKNKVHLLMKN